MTEGSELTCVSCGREAGYNRAVVDTLTDELVGGLCLRCERHSYGMELNGAANPDGPECTFCAHDGFFAVPKWRIRRPSGSARRDALTVGYAVEGTTARLCDGHFHSLAKATDPATADAPGEREPYDRL